MIRSDDFNRADGPLGSDWNASTGYGQLAVANNGVAGTTIDKSSPSAGITVTNAFLGQATLQLEPGDTVPIPAFGVYAGPCEITMQVGSEAYEYYYRYRCDS